MFGQYVESYPQHFGHCSLDVVLRLTQSVFGSTGFHGAEKSVDNCFHWLHQIHCHWHCYDQIHSLLHHQKSKTDTLSYMHRMSQYTQEYIQIGICCQTRNIFKTAWLTVFSSTTLGWGSFSLGISYLDPSTFINFSLVRYNMFTVHSLESSFI